VTFPHIRRQKRGVAVLSEPIEGLIAEAVLYRLNTPQLAAALAGKAAAEKRRCFDYLATYRRQGFASAAPTACNPQRFFRRGDP
jgi:hypothetical protein